jgi:hypothetical protein
MLLLDPKERRELGSEKLGRLVSIMSLPRATRETLSKKAEAKVEKT